MDPVTAFSLAAGVIQVIDVSSKALSKCREIHKDGSLAQNRATEEITEYLATTTEHLKESVHHASSSASKESKDIIDVAQKCSETAAKLLSELRKLKCDAGGGAFQTLRSSVRTFQQRKFLAESQQRLEKYQNILDTRILAKLDAQSILQNVQLKTVDQKVNTTDQNVKDLALALSQGRNTVAQLFSEQTIALREHIDRRFEDQAQRDAFEKAKQQFKESLFFPEIFARQDNITRSHEGTCRWIFWPDEEFDESRSRLSATTESLRTRPWPNFAQWLAEGGDVYWFSGNPGSGKSTLMKYIIRELRGFCRTKDILNKWDTEGTLVICSFFFWKLGSPLQKDYAGFLRSILYQIVEQREDILPILIGQNTTLESTSYRSAPIYAWTRERLDDAMRCFIVNKPASIRLCLVVDGLDEYEGDEDFLMETVKYLSRDPGTRICVSSRREQIFRLGFKDSPQLRLHDLNQHDIEKATRERLCPVLEHHFPNSTKDIDLLIKLVTYRSEGVFLWADLMCKDLRSGVRNADSMQELLERLDRTPDDIQGLYEHMLSRLDKSYLREAAEYFRLLLAAQSLSFEKMTTLHIACGQEAAWNCVLNKDFAYFWSLGFQESCDKLETRILTRCAGLVEIDESPLGFSDWLYVRDNVSRHLCEVRFIHRTIKEFLESHQQFFQEPGWQWTASLAIHRGRIGVMLPVSVSEARFNGIHLTAGLEWLRNITCESLVIENRRQVETHRESSHHNSIQVIDQIYEVAHYAYASLDGLDRILSESPAGSHNYIKTIPNVTYHLKYIKTIPTITYHLPLQDRLGFAAYYGSYEYVSQYMSMKSFSGLDLDFILFCATVGLDDIGCLSYKSQLVPITGLLRIVLSCLSHSDRSEVHFPKHFSTKSDTQISKWVLFIKCSMRLFLHWHSLEEYYSTSPDGVGRLWKDIVAYFLEHHKSDDRAFLSCWYALVTIKDYEDDTEYMDVWYWLEESVLAWMQSCHSLRDTAFAKDTTALLVSHGKLGQRSFRSIELRVGRASRKILHLTDSQSESLTNAWSKVVPWGPACPLMTAPNETRPVELDAETEKLVRMMLYVAQERSSHSKRETSGRYYLSWKDDY